MFCPNCGTKNDDTASTCTKCGFKLGGPAGAKFRGTMMLNAEQSVQGMVDEHRRKLQEATAARESAEGPEGASPAPPEAVFKGSAGSGGAPKRRMGTMLGVAPQVGGVRPPNFHGGPTPPLPSAVAPVPEAAGAVSAPDPLGGTVAFGAISSLVEPPAPSPGATPPSPLAAGRTEAFAAPAVAPVAAASSLAAGRTEAFDATPPPIEQPSMEQHAPALRSSPDSYTPAGVPRRLTPLDVFLIVITFGLYALVLRARQRKARS